MHLASLIKWKIKKHRSHTIVLALSSSSSTSSKRTKSKRENRTQNPIKEGGVQYAILSILNLIILWKNDKDLRMSKRTCKELKLPKWQVMNSHFQIEKLTIGTYQITVVWFLHCPVGILSSLFVLLKVWVSYLSLLNQSIYIPSM